MVAIFSIILKLSCSGAGFSNTALNLKRRAVFFDDTVVKNELNKFATMKIPHYG